MVVALSWPALVQKSLASPMFVLSPIRAIPVNPTGKPFDSCKWYSFAGEITVYVEPEVVRRLKHLATDHDTTLRALGVEAFERLLAGG